MHEMSIAMSIVESVAERARQEGCERVTGIEIVVGRLSGVQVESLRFCFDAATRGTPVEGAELSIEDREPSGACDACGAEFPVAGFHACCPVCGLFRVRIVSGEELAVKTITIE
ncbi:MAG: hydrogenase maturation nickel metallochaperone HypA [Chlorobiaceae bacterium]|nr:hydrogenase maturation nickel metallochaperone HypA [Chlorobiaceae bacterium]